MGKLAGKVALVTGSGRNIGRGTVLKLAGEGAHVVVNARSNQAEAEAVVREAEALGVKAIAVVADVASKDQVEAMAERALSAFGRVDILINNAAIRPHKPFTELTAQDWEAVRGVVLDGALYLTRALIGSMVQHQYGRILFFTGEGAFAGGSGRAHVSAAKMGLVGFARGLASEFAAQNIRVNVVSPGSIDTMRANPEWYGNRPPNAAGIPLGRQGKVEEIAATCLIPRGPVGVPIGGSHGGSHAGFPWGPDEGFRGGQSHPRGHHGGGGNPSRWVDRETGVRGDGGRYFLPYREIRCFAFTLDISLHPDL